MNVVTVEELLWQLEAEKAINQVLADDLKKLQARVKEYEYKFAMIRSLASGKEKGAIGNE